MCVRSARVIKLRSTAIGIACLCTIASAPLALTAMSQRGIDVPGVSAAHRLMAMLDARSPGEREKGDLSKTKIAKNEASSGPRQRALGKVFPPKPSPVEQLAKVLVPSPAPPTLQSVPPIAPLTVADIIAPASPPAIAGLASNGPGIIGGSSLGGGGPSGAGGSPPGISNVTPPPPVTSPVPEPGTWLMMLIGFGMIGSAVSRRRPRRVNAELA